MGEVHYMISEASKRVGVESHVLRHWEEELNLPIERTEMGHRYYTEENLRFFQCVKRLKEEGILLKEIKEHMPDLQRAREHKSMTMGNKQEKDEKLDAIRTLIGQVLKEELEANNQILTNNIGFLINAKDQLEEERYKKLDAHIRQQQTLRKEAAKSSPIKRLKQILDYAEG